MRVLLTGAAGFVGGRVHAELVAHGYDVLTTDRHGNVDITGDLASCEFVKTLPDVDAVVHCAAVQYATARRPRFVRARWFHRNNVQATANLVRRYSGSVRFFLLIGTSMMFTQKESGRPYAVADEMGGEGVYSKSKLAAAHLVRAMENPTAVLIPTIIAGPGRAGLFGALLRVMRSFRIVVLPGTGDALTQMVHVDDVASLARLIVAEESAGYFNAGGAEPLTIKDWLAILQDELPRARRVRLRIPYALVRSLAWLTAYRFLAREQVVMLGHDHVLAMTESEALGWRPRYGNETILRQTARALLAGEKNEVGR
ncbi:NAD-dependent epimerase/dehydratase family protein [Microbacterium sp.]|uniref:NAD-dependent epimerase/dehydratase family protein n=1 Tax=Microbacterium sp. TaxID=51671 RepID=UPI003A93273D